LLCLGIPLIGHLLCHLFESGIDTRLHLTLLSISLSGIGARMILIKLFEEICLRVMSLIVLLQVGFGEEELGTVTALDHILLLLGWESHEVLVRAQCLLLDL